MIAMKPTQWRRRLLRLLAIGLAVGLPAYYVLVVHSPSPEGEFPLDLAKVRALAESLPGAKATQVRFESPMAFTFTEAMVTAGDPWRKTPVPVFSYQVVFPDHTLVIDSAMDHALANGTPLVTSYDDAAYQHMAAALASAALIVVTHEHLDHLGGLASHPGFAGLVKALRLTEEQVANSAGLKPAVLPAAAMQGYQPLCYDNLLALAPGVVLIKAPGHTVGSQLVYVRRADGRELLFLGDVAWHLRNVQTVRERPLFMTLMIGEDRQRVLAELQTLHRLTIDEPGVKLVPGHDGEVVKALADEGLLTKGFAL